MLSIYIGFLAFQSICVPTFCRIHLHRTTPPLSFINFYGTWLVFVSMFAFNFIEFFFIFCWQNFISYFFFLNFFPFYRIRTKFQLRLMSNLSTFRNGLQTILDTHSLHIHNHIQIQILRPLIPISENNVLKIRISPKKWKKKKTHTHKTTTTNPTRTNRNTKKFANFTHTEINEPDFNENSSININ